MAGGAGSYGRAEADFYATPPEATRALCGWLVAQGLTRPGTVVWEPACGDGAMSRVLEAQGLRVVSTDVRATGYGRVCDFLATAPREDGRCLPIITNPPFCLAEQFIRHAVAVNAPWFALLLKAQYWSAATRLKLHADCPPAAALPLTWRLAFCPERGASPPMDVAWFFWSRETRPFIYQPLRRPAQEPTA